MKRFHFISVCLLLATTGAMGQTARYTIELKDKAGTPFSLSKPSDYLSAKAIQRRQRQNISIDSTDLPVSPAYLQKIAAVAGARVMSTSRWLNNVLVETDNTATLDTIKAFPFVKGSSPAGVARRSKNRNIFSKSGTRVKTKANADTDSLFYGNSYAQVHIHEGEFLHGKGFRGEGITIAVLDAGFYSYKTNPTFDSLRLQGRVLGEFDFVANETSVNEDNAHGANCLSILASNEPGRIVGSAPRASYWLFRTEDAPTEKPIEEQNWAVAAERADSAGADMISSSLGYTGFDDPAFNHTYADRDGNTALITIAADFAAKKGMIVLNAAGNSGAANNEERFVSCPADGDSVVTVGAVDVNGNIAPFSCYGPNGAGKRKPNIVSMGVAAVYGYADGKIYSGGGTSYSTPNVAGLIACLWQAFPEFTNMEIIDAVQRSADRFQTPDDRYGYGIPNFRIAYDLLAVTRQSRLDRNLSQSWITAYPVPFRQQFTVYFKAPTSGNASLRLIDIAGRTVQLKTLQVETDGYYTIPMTAPIPGSGTYYLQYADGKNKSILKLISL